MAASRSAKSQSQPRLRDPGVESFLPRNPFLPLIEVVLGFADARCRATEVWFASCWFVVWRVAPIPKTGASY